MQFFELMLVVENVMMERANLQEGKDDSYESSPFSRQMLHNGAKCRNIDIAGLLLTNEDPSAQVNNIVTYYGSFYRLSNGIANSFIPLQQNFVQHTLIDIVQNYNEITNLMQDEPPKMEGCYVEALEVLDQ